MLKKNLKRFAKLENKPSDFINSSCLRASKRFERLEIEDKIVEFTITDKIYQFEKAPADITYYYFCPYCAKTNPIDAKDCDHCGKPLTEYLNTPQASKHLLKKCICGSMNIKERKNCWVCGRDFFLWGDKDANQSSDNVITLNIDGQIYKSNDNYLPLNVLALMERIRKEGYSSQLIDKWIQERNQNLEEKKESEEVEISGIKNSFLLRLAGLAILIIFVILGLRSCRI